MDKKILLVGGTTVKSHFSENCFSDCKIVNKYFGMSPFSLGECPRVQNVSKLRLTLPLRYDVNNDFSGFLKNNSADFIIVDLQKILVDLLDIDGHYCTNQPKNEDSFYAENQDKRVVVTDLEYEHFYNVFDNFAQLIRDNYEPERIVLLASYVPKFFTTGRQVRSHKNKFAYNDWYTHFEKRFVEKTGCVFYDKSKYYFNEKQVGKPIKFATFEELYYEEAKTDFKLIFKGEKYAARPNYKNSVLRYVRYSATLDKKFLSVFLSAEDSVDRFLMSCPDEFVLKNSDEFVTLKKDGLKKSVISSLFESSLSKTYKAFLLAEKTPDEKIKNIDLLFENRIRVTQLLKYIRAKSNVTFPKQITYDNYGYYYHDKTPSELLRMVDVVGSCVSRFIFNYNEDKFAVNNYAFHYMPIMTDVKASYSDKLFNTKIWEHKMMKLQADCGLSDYVNKCKAEWVVVDLFPLIELTAYLIDGKPIGAPGHFGKKKGFQEVLIYERYTEEEIFAELKKYAQLLKSLYGEKIILIAARRQIKKVDDTNKIVPYTNPAVNNMRNEKCRIYEKAFCEYSNCWYVDIVDQFVSHEQSFVSESPVHYEDDCYYEEGKIIKKIVDEMPSQKHFSGYDIDVRLNRIISFKESGNDEEALRIVFRKWQDEVVIKLNEKKIKSNYDLLKDLYQIEELTEEFEQKLKKAGLY